MGFVEAYCGAVVAGLRLVCRNTHAGQQFGGYRTLLMSPAGDP